MVSRPASSRIGRHALIALVICLLGAFAGHALAAIAITSLGYLVWVLASGVKLNLWLMDPTEVPERSFGLWEQSFSQMWHLLEEGNDELARLKDARSEFQVMLNTLPEGILAIDAKNNLSWFNDAAGHLLDLQSGEDIGKPITNLLREPDFVEWITMTSGSLGSLEMMSPTDRNLRLRANAHRLQNDRRLLVVSDITEKHSLEIMRRDFVANVSHELRTPVTVLLGYLEAVEDQCDQDVQPAIIRMQGQAKQMQSLLDDLLELSRLQSRDTEQVAALIDVPALLMQLKEQSEELSKHHHDIRFQIQPGLNLSGSEKDIESAFQNLITNAIHYTPAGGVIHVRWEQLGNGDRIFKVSDTGIGIPTKDIPRITERFYRVGSDRSRESGGTGLGLAIVKHVLSTHGARLEIKSDLGIGSTFTCIFPASDRSAPKEEAP